MRVRRIGSTTAGISLIAIGITFIISIFMEAPNFLISALRFWPVILISLGAEILLATYVKSETERKFDFASIVIMILCILFAFGCEGTRLSMEYYLR